MRFARDQFDGDLRKRESKKRRFELKSAGLGQTGEKLPVLAQFDVQLKIARPFKAGWLRVDGKSPVRDGRTVLSSRTGLGGLRTTPPSHKWLGYCQKPGAQGTEAKARCSTTERGVCRILCPNGAISFSPGLTASRATLGWPFPNEPNPEGVEAGGDHRMM